MDQGDVLKYSKGSRFFHWLIAFLVILMLAFSFFIQDLPKPKVPVAFMVHKSFGVCIFVLMWARLYWLIRTGRPSLPAVMPLWEKVFARFVEYGLYLFLLLQPICGYIMSVASNHVPTFFGLFTLPKFGIPQDKNLAMLMNDAHVVIAFILIALLICHIAGATKHEVIDHDRVLKTML